MLRNAHISCDDYASLRDALEDAVQLCLNTDLPMRIIGHCKPTVKGGDGSGGIMLSVFENSAETLYSIHTNFLVEHEIFNISNDIKNRLRRAGKMINYIGWEEEQVTHILTVNTWDFGIIASDTEAVFLLAKFGGKLRKARRPYVQQIT